jgi:hypothetical protein
MFIDRSFGNRVPSEIRVELVASQGDLLSQLRTIVRTVGVPGGNTEGWIENRMALHAHGDLMIFTARVGRLLVGFMMLDKSTMTSSYSWIVPRFRNKGLGERFYSFACINLGAPTPCFVFPRDMTDEYATALKGVPIEASNDAGFCAIHPTAAVKAA